MRAKKTENGFSLIEMTIALIVIMAIAVPLAVQYQAWASKKKVDDTKQRAERIASAISQFYETSRFYPCPARPTLASTIREFGQQDCLNTIIAGQPILVGTVPFKTIGLQEQDVIDGWGRAFSYTVTRVLADESNRDSTAPGALDRTYIDYVDTDDDGLYDTFVTYSSLFPDTEAFRSPPQVFVAPLPAILVSHGETGVGGRLTSTGGFFAPCPANIAVARDANNCNNDAFFLSNEGAEGLNDRDTGPTANFFDDYVFPLKAQTGQIWRQTGDNQEQNVISTVPRLGINTPQPMGGDTEGNPPLYAGVSTDGQPLTDEDGKIMYESGMDVNGNIQVDEATLAGQYCDTAGRNVGAPVCFEVKSIAGEDGIKCDESEKIPMTGVARNDAQCTKVSPLRTAGDCPEDHYVIGFTASGGIICN